MGEKLIGREVEKEWFLHWLSSQNRRTTVLFVSGIPGVGKTFLMRYFEEVSSENAAQTEWIDCALLDSERVMHCLQEISKSRIVSQSMDSPADVHSNSLQEPFILFVDHLDTQSETENYISNQWIRCMPKHNLLLVLIKRSRSSIHQYCHTWLLTAWHDMYLEPFTRQEATQFLRSFSPHLDSLVIHQMIGLSAGHPMILTDFVYQDANPTHRFTNEGFPNLFAILTDSIDDTDTMDVLCSLAFMLEGNQEDMCDFLRKEVSWLTYRRVSNLSYIQHQLGDLVIHPVVAYLLRLDFHHRMPRRAQEWSQKAVLLFLERIEQESTSERKRYWFSQLCLLLSEAQTHQQLLFPQTNSLFYQDDFYQIIVPSGKEKRQQLMDWLEKIPHSLDASGGQEEMVDWFEQMAEQNTQCIRVLEDREGQIAAMQMVVSHYEHLPKRVRAQMAKLSHLEKELGMALDAAPLVLLMVHSPDVLDSTLDEWRTRFLCYQLASQNSHVQPLIFLGQASIPTYLRFHPWLKNVSVSGVQKNSGIPLYTLQLKKEELQQAHALSVHYPSENGVELRTAHEHELILSEDDVREILQHLHHLEYLDTFVRERKMNLTVSELRDKLVGILVADQIPPPLTREQQRLLRITYMDRPGTVIAISHRLAMSRTTYYRVLAQAHHHFTLALRS
ncbi:hypothetical protein ACOJUR_04570 [Alicyclobacillus tolerans]|uniref:hypothetical protein n=1 Tax=Alicyclobacillus tolerans TaxID=90970 RepID=UPI003B7E679A